jgi:hypothetical protein
VFSERLQPMIAIFSEAFRLLRRHFVLFTAIILTVWLPGNILLNYLAYHIKGTDDTSFLGLMKTSTWIEAIFGPLYSSALVYALSEIKSGRSVKYRQAMAVGLSKWGSLFAARFVAGIFIGLGLLALIIPGIVVAVRYAFLDAVVVLEESKVATNARTRSALLTDGRRWQIFWSALLYVSLLTVLSFALNFSLGFFDSLNITPVEVVLDCALDITYAIIQIVMFLFYWEATSVQRLAGHGATPNGRQAATFGDFGLAEGPSSVS